MSDLSEIANKIQIDTWYKFVVVVSAIVFGFSLFIDTKWIPNKIVVLISLGTLLFSLGEWKQEKYVQKLNNMGFMQYLHIQYKKRIMDLGGFILNLLGLFFIIWGIREAFLFF